ncbi:hypothetical protein [Pedobacter panaciterrae]
MNLTSKEQLAKYQTRVNQIKKQGVKHPICEGFYKIKEIHRIIEYTNKVVLLVTADWKPLNAVKDDQPCTILLRLDPLFYSESKGNKEEQPKLLLGNIIKVQETEVYQQEYNHELGTYMKVVWSLHKAKLPPIQMSPDLIPDDLQEGHLYKVTDEDQIKKLLNSKPNFQ